MFLSTGGRFKKTLPMALARRSGLIMSKIRFQRLSSKTETPYIYSEKPNVFDPDLCEAFLSYMCLNTVPLQKLYDARRQDIVDFCEYMRIKPNFVDPVKCR